MKSIKKVKISNIFLFLSLITAFSFTSAYSATFTYTLTYDAANRVTRVTADGSNQTDYTWQDNGQVVSRSRTGTEPVAPYTIAVSTSENGSVAAPSANIDCGSTCIGTADQGTNIVVTATADTDYAFSAWTGDCATETTSTCTLAMDADKSVFATFSVDQDNDGVSDSSDNCPTIANLLQENNDGDSLGDVCDPDDDNDFVDDTTDNCPLTSNPSQMDTDSDGSGDACDTDDDNDGVADGSDSNSLNPTICQDLDSDTCDDCSVGQDGFGPLTDYDPANDGTDTDTDGQCDAGDPDDDNDGVTDGSDTSSLNPDVCQDLDGDTCDDCSVGQDDFGPLTDYAPANDGTDTDTDGQCDAGDLDDDGDSVADVSDNCPTIANFDQADSDSDGVGDVCDPCPSDPNKSQPGDQCGYQLTVSLSEKGVGTVTSEPVGIVCNNDCGETYDYNVEVTLTATPLQGSKFAGWSGDCSGTAFTCKVTIDSVKNVVAEFHEFPWAMFLPAITGVGEK